METPQPIPVPQTIDPDRPLRDRDPHMIYDPKPETELLQAALHESCDYAQQLWDNLNAMRTYLLNNVPTVDPDQPGYTPSARPTGPDDEQSWQDWIDAYAAITSVLCGPHGDSGFGLARAHQEAQRHRSHPSVPTDHTAPPDHEPPAVKDTDPSAGDGDGDGRTPEPDRTRAAPSERHRLDGHHHSHRYLARVAWIAAVLGVVTHRPHRQQRLRTRTGASD